MSAFGRSRGRVSVSPMRMPRLPTRWLVRCLCHSPSFQVIRPTKARWLRIILTTCCLTVMQFAVVWHIAIRQRELMPFNCWQRLAVIASVRFSFYPRGKPPADIYQLKSNPRARRAFGSLYSQNRGGGGLLKYLNFYQIIGRILPRSRTDNEFLSCSTLL